MLHMPDYDYSTVPDCSTLLGCLSTVLSAMEASQLPMVLFLEYKSENATEMLDGLAGEGTAEAINEYLASYEGRPDALTSGEGVSAEDWAAIQADVLSVIPRDRVIAPADIEVINGKVR